MAMLVNAAGKLRNVEIEYKRNRNIYLRLGPDGSLRVTCPRRVTQEQIRRFIAEKENWIRRAEQQENRRQEHSLCGEDGKYACWLGKILPVVIEQADRDLMIAEEDCIRFWLKDRSPENIRKVFYETAAKQLLIMINDRRGEWDASVCRANDRPLPLISLPYMTSRWGSCTPSKASIRISLRLIHYPPVCLDYVLLHEYVHMLVPDHSAAFYANVRARMPEYKKAIRLLK